MQDIIQKLRDLSTASLVLEPRRTSINPPASTSQIEKIAKFFDNKIPEDFIEFLQNMNGCELYNDDDIDGFLFYSIDEIIQETKDLKECYEDDWDENIIIFATIIGEGNYLGFKISKDHEYEIVDCFHEDSPKDWKSIIGKSFSGFLNTLIEKKGEKFWLGHGKTID